MTRATLIGLSAFIAAIAMVAAVRQAWPHDAYWGKTNPVTGENCCHSVDCRPVDDPREIGESGAFYTWQGMRFPKAQSQPSHDSRYHVCPAQGQHRIRCLLRPSPGV